MTMRTKSNTIIIFAWIIFILLGGLIYKHDLLQTSSRTVSNMYQLAFRQPEFSTEAPSQGSTLGPTQGPKQGPTLILLLTYMRSGSSLVGDILQHMPDAFYVYEPLRMFGILNKYKGTIRYVNGTTRAPPYSFNDEAVNLLKHWFTCNITSLHADSLRDTLFLEYGLKTRKYIKCLRTMRYSRIKPEKNKQVCIENLKNLCEKSLIRVIKTIRMELGAVRELLDILPYLKIVHLVRDARATLMSQMMMGICDAKHGDPAGCINKHCTRVENDILEEEKLHLNYTSRLKSTLYETMASDPLGTSKELYQFCGGEFTTSAQEYIYTITLAGNPDNCEICTVRSNATEHIDMWKSRISGDFLNMIQERCNFVLKRYKYEMYNYK